MRSSPPHEPLLALDGDHATVPQSRAPDQRDWTELIDNTVVFASMATQGRGMSLKLRMAHYVRLGPHCLM